MDLVFTVLVSLFLSLLSVLWRKTTRDSRYPPGPPTIPFVGNLNLVTKDMIVEFRKLRKKYGDVFSLVMGTQTVVVVNGIDTLKELFMKHADVVSGRPDVFVMKEMAKYRGIANTSGSLWKEHRTFALTTLRDFGFGKRSLQDKILEEVEVFIDVIKQEKGKAFNISDYLHTSISNVICSVALGERFEHTDRKFRDIIHAVTENLNNADVTGLLTFLPFLKYIPGDPVNYKGVMSNVDKIIESLKNVVVDHQRDFCHRENTNYLDAYLDYQQTHKDVHSTFTDEQLLWSLGDLFAAGTETTATTLKWFILFMLKNPTIEQRMRKEIHDVVGESRYPTLEDRSNLPLCDAVLYETLRLGNIVAFGAVPHGLTKDLEFKGHLIPKHALIIPCLDSILNDPDLFENPSVFNPDRFIDQNGKLRGIENVLTFGLGRRVCLGEALAKMELFLFATSLIQRFKLLPDDGCTLPSISEYKMGITRAPLPYMFRVVEWT